MSKVSIGDVVLVCPAQSPAIVTGVNNDGSLDLTVFVRGAGAIQLCRGLQPSNDGKTGAGWVPREPVAVESSTEKKPSTQRSNINSTPVPKAPPLDEQPTKKL